MKYHLVRLSPMAQILMHSLSQLPKAERDFHSAIEGSGLQLRVGVIYLRCIISENAILDEFIILIYADQVF